MEMVMMMKRTELYVIPLNAHLDTVMSNEQSDSVAVIHCLLKAVQQVSCLQEKKKSRGICTTSHGNYTLCHETSQKNGFNKFKVHIV